MIFIGIAFAWTFRVSACKFVLLFCLIELVKVREVALYSIDLPDKSRLEKPAHKDWCAELADE